MTRRHINDLAMAEDVRVDEDRVRMHLGEHRIGVGIEELWVEVKSGGVAVGEGDIGVGDADQLYIAVFRQGLQQAADVVMFQTHDDDTNRTADRSERRCAGARKKQ